MIPTKALPDSSRKLCLLFAALSPGLAALTVGCDSGNLGAMSRVQLLLLNRLEAGTPPSPLSLEEELPARQDWSHLRLQHLEPAGKSDMKKHVSSSTSRRRHILSAGWNLDLIVAPGAACLKTNIF